MIKLPELFPYDQLSTIDRIQVEWFYTKYTDEYYEDYKFGHFLMAAYAAVPAYLTPDLLYKLWQNFGEYKWQGNAAFIHPIAVNDILLAPFCHEVSYELYKMDENTRLSFLKWITSGDQLWESLQPHSLSDIAEFIESYHDRPNETMVREGARYREDQLMEVKVYRNPQEVAGYYLEKLRKALDDKNEQEILALISSLKKAIKKESYTGYTTTTILGNLFKENQLELWKNVIQQNNTVIAELLEQLSKDPTDGNLIQLKGTANAHAIHIKETETKLVNRFDALVNPVNYAFIIGCSKDDASNCTLFENTLKRIQGKDGWKIKAFDKITTKAGLVRRLKSELAAITTGDNLLIYLSAARSAITHDRHCQVLYYDAAIADIEFSRLIAAAQAPATLTMVIDCEHAATSYWMDTGKPGCALFAASHADNREMQEHRVSFTNAFCTVLAKHSGHLSNRQLYIGTLKEMAQERDISPARLHSNRKTYYRKFASEEVPDVLLQHNLRLCGYLHSTGGVVWNNEAQAALAKFTTDLKLSIEAPNINELVAARVQSNARERKPLLLFIFTDVDKTLAAMAQEIHAIKANVRNSPLFVHTEIKVFQNRPLKEVNDFVRNEACRNRIQMVYYSGYDTKGIPRFPDGVIDLPMWSDWLAFHDNLEIVVLNTCNSDLLAARLSQIGVRMAIGCHGEVMDDDAAAFGSSFIKAMAENQPLSVLQMQKG